MQLLRLLPYYPCSIRILLLQLPQLALLCESAAAAAAV
jgi:hypothetical protein